jgi:RNA polymerase sigma-70 factor (ECF subfamily)
MKDRRTMATGRLEDWLSHAGWLRRLARGLVLDDAEADDVLQETWLAALEAGDVTHPRAWLAGTLRRVVQLRGRTEGRRRVRERQGARDEGVPGDVESLELVERQERLLELVRALPPVQRDALVARYFEGLTPRAIARRHELALETVKSRLKRGLAALRADLDREHGDRRAWAAWLLPLARREAGVASLSVATWLTLGTVAIALAGVVLIVARSWNAPTLEPGPVEVAVANPAPSPPEPDAASQVQDSARRPAPAGPITRVIVLEPDGRAAAGARVVTVDRARFERLDPALIERHGMDVERMFQEMGRTWETNAQGVALVEHEPPFLLWASSAAGSSTREVAEAGAVTLSLRPVPALVVRALDSGGRTLEDVPVAAEMSLREPDDDWPGDDTRLSFVRDTTTQGVAFQDPLGFWSKEPGGPQRGYWTRARLSLPGAPEVGAQLRLSVDPTATDPAELAVDLELPPLGALVLEVRAPREELATLDGEVVLHVMAGERPVGDAFPAPLVDGRARWPRVALGLRYDLAVEIPGRGSRWTLQGAGPVAEGDEVLLETRLPSRPAMIGRLRRPDGALLADATLQVWWPDVQGVTAPHALRTDEGGHLRLEWPEGHDGASRVLFLFEPEGRFSERIELAEVALATSPNGEVDAGELQLVARERAGVSGRVVGPDGEPIVAATVTATQLTGVRFGGRTDQDGVFAIPGPFADRIDVTVRTERPELPVAEFHVARPGPGEQVELALEPGASLRGSLALPAFVEARRLRVLLFREDGDDWSQATLEPDGVFVARGLVTGRWRLELRMNGNAALSTVEGIVVHGDGLVRDARLEGLAVGELLREIDVRAPGVARPELIELVVSGPGELLDRPGFRQSRLLPRTGQWSARFQLHGRRTLVFEDATALPEVVELAFGDPITVQLRATSSIPSGTGIELRGEPGGPAHGEIVALPAPGPDGSWSVALPAPGTYRLVRSSRHDTGGAVLASMEETACVIEVVDAPGQGFEVDPGAPARSRAVPAAR